MITAARIVSLIADLVELATAVGKELDARDAKRDGDRTGEAAGAPFSTSLRINLAGRNRHGRLPYVDLAIVTGDSAIQIGTGVLEQIRSASE